MIKPGKESIINRIETELLAGLIEYVLPFIDDKINKK